MGNEQSAPPAPPAPQEPRAAEAVASPPVPRSAGSTGGAAGAKLKEAVGTARWLLLPTIYVASVWALYVRPSAVAARLPALWLPPSAKTSAHALLPLHPKTMTQAFALGKLAQTCKNKWCPVQTLKAAAQVVGRDSVSEAELLGVEALLEQMDKRGSIVNSLTGLLNFVNIVWLFSILGIMCTAVPVVVAIFGPLIAAFVIKPLMLLARRAWGALRPLILKAIDLGVEAVTACHELGVFEALAYAASFLVVLTGSAYPPEHISAGTMVALTGAAMFGPCWAYSCALFAPAWSRGGGGLGFFSSLLVGLVLVPLALKFQSGMLGFFAVAMLYQSLGFTAFATLFCYCVGFEGERSLIRCAVASKCLLLCAVLALWSGSMQHRYLAPFETGIMVWGSIVYYLALLISSSLLNCMWTGGRGGGKAAYIRNNIIMFVSLVLYAYCGALLSAPALTNTAVTFCVLWLMEKQAEGLGVNIFSIFFGCVALYFAAHHLSTHPEFLMAMLDSRGVLTSAAA